MTEEHTEHHSSESKEVSFTIKKQDMWKYGAFILGALFLISLFWNPLDSGTGGGAGNAVPTAPPTQAPPSQPSQVIASPDDDARIGPADAPVEIIEFSDFQCPFCARAAPTVKQIVSEYGDQVSVVYRDFPLDSIHPMATPAAIAAECVRENGGDETFFEYHDKIFANQQGLSIDNLKLWAQELGHNIDNCLDSQKYLDEVKKDLADAQAAGGRGTPYFVINGKPLSGAQPFEAFKQVIDAELA